MMSRLILVGLVGALGISVQTWSEIQRGIGSVHAWTTAQLAAWDAPVPGDSGPIGVAFLPEVPHPRFEPILADEHASGLADELNRASEGLEIPPQPVIVRRRPNEPREKVQAVRLRSDFSAVPALDTIELKLMAALLRAADESDAEGRSDEAPLRVRRSKPVMTPAVCTFTPAFGGTNAAHQPIGAPNSTGSNPGGLAREPDRIEPVLDAENGFAWELNRSAEGTEVLVGTPAVPARSQPAFDPIAPEVNTGAGLADELNRASEGLIVAVDAMERSLPASTVAAAHLDPPHLARHRPERSAPPEPSSDVAQAMRLTREAVHAWMNIMTSPSLLHLSAR